MKTFEQLAQSAYTAYRKKAIEVDEEEGLGVHADTWTDLDSVTRECWVSAATQLWAEFSALH